MTVREIVLATIPDQEEVIQLAWMRIIQECVVKNRQWTCTGMKLLTFENPHTAGSYMILHFNNSNPDHLRRELFKVPESLDGFMDDEFDILDYFFPDEDFYTQAYIIGFILGYKY